MTARAPFIVVFVTVVALCGCVAGSASGRFFPKSNFDVNRAKPVAPEQVQVLLDSDVPTCDFYEIGSIVYEPNQLDGKPNTETVAIENTRELAAQYGASGIYKIRSRAAGTSGLAVGNGSFAVASAQSDVGLHAVAYKCRPPHIPVKGDAR